MANEKSIGKYLKYSLIALAGLVGCDGVYVDGKRVDNQTKNYAVKRPIQIFRPAPVYEEVQQPVQREYPINDISNRTPSSNYRRSAGRRAVNNIILHTTESTSGSARNTFQNGANQVSAHYLIDEDGNIDMIVNPNDVAYHARQQNANSIGIEFAGHHNRPLNQNQIDAGANLINRLQMDYPGSQIRAHSEVDPSR